MPRAEAKYRITADDRTARGLRSAESRLERFGRAIRRGVAAAAGTAALAFAAISRNVTAAGKRLDEFAKSGKEIATDAEDFRELAIAAETLGVPIAKATKAADKFGDAIGEALTGNQEYTELFDLLGVSPEAFRQIDDVTDRLQVLFDALDQLKQAYGDEVAGAVERGLIGRNLTKLGANAGRDFAQAIEQANLDGLIEGTNESAAAAERAADAWLRAGQLWAKFFEDSRFFQAMESGANRLSDVALQLREGRERRDPSLGRSTAEGLIPALAIFNWLRDAFNRERQAPAQQSGIFAPGGQSIGPLIPEKLTKSATALERAAVQLERNVNRYAP